MDPVKKLKNAYLNALGLRPITSRSGCRYTKAFTLACSAGIIISISIVVSVFLMMTVFHIPLSSGDLALAVILAILFILTPELPRRAVSIISVLEPYSEDITVRASVVEARLKRGGRLCVNLNTNVSGILKLRYEDPNSKSPFEFTLIGAELRVIVSNSRLSEAADLFMALHEAGLQRLSVVNKPWINVYCEFTSRNVKTAVSLFSSLLDAMKDRRNASSIALAIARTLPERITLDHMRNELLSHYSRLFGESSARILDRYIDTIMRAENCGEKTALIKAWTACLGKPLS